MEEDKIIVLINKYLDGTITETEREQLLSHYDSNTGEDVEWMATHLEEPALVKARMMLEIRKEIFPEKRRSPIFRTLIRTAAAAAILLMVGGTALYFLKPGPKPGSTHSPLPEMAKIKPGADKAILKLADGKVIVLDSTAAGEVLNQSGIKITKTKDGQVVYSVVKQDVGGTMQLAASGKWNTISTPKGGQYKISLPDGTMVWLNAASSLKFPEMFTGKERRVELTGEAYFEVAKNRNMPFKVKTELQEVEVLGTHFNIMAYENEQQIKTTLLEGAVKVNSNGNESLLKPGQQAALDKTNDRLKIRNVATEEAVAWKNGRFMFVDEDLRSILNKVSRWYDVEIVYESYQSSRHYSGVISRFDDVSEVLKTMEMTGTVHFRIAGRRIYVRD